MNSRSTILRYGFGLAAAMALALLSACTTDRTPSAPGPHQGSGAVDGKGGVTSPGPHQGG